MGCWSLGDKQDPACESVQAMDDAAPGRAGPGDGRPMREEKAGKVRFRLEESGPGTTEAMRVAAACSLSALVREAKASGVAGYGSIHSMGVLFSATAGAGGASAQPPVEPVQTAVLEADNGDLSVWTPLEPSAEASPIGSHPLRRKTERTAVCPR